MTVSRHGILENPKGFSQRFGKVVERINPSTPLNVVPWEKHRREGYVYGDHAFVGGVEFYYVTTFPTKDAAVEWAQEHVEGRSSPVVTENRIRVVNMYQNIDRAPPSVLITRKSGEYHVLTDDTTSNYHRQQDLLKAWRESVAKDDPEILRQAYWGVAERTLREENRVDTSQVPAEVVDTLSRAGFTAKTTEEEVAGLMSGISGIINAMRRDAGLAPLPPVARPMVSGDAVPGRAGKPVRRRPVHVSSYRRKR